MFLTVKEKLAKGDFSESLFSEVKAWVYHLMMTASFPRYLTSDEYLKVASQRESLTMTEQMVAKFCADCKHKSVRT